MDNIADAANYKKQIAKMETTFQQQQSSWEKISQKYQQAYEQYDYYSIGELAEL
ncbi:hypothetical protein [Lentibacillus sp. Marseille-P4043]|uniref:hypothetical protein n=1 Tax=Lentibacillus sp. Marseille-P4043 TaxID=2040293 RepID=UPI00131A5FB8|nr:hypothetical protein [Lentibacillus sp. Marseille-P4043]